MKSSAAWGRMAGSPPPARRGRLRRGAMVTPRPVHLRLRGEHAGTGAAATSRDGSPPPARRALVLGDCPEDVCRPTFARAESTPVGDRRPAIGSAHLRSRGEHGPGRPATRCARHRFTSACAERTSSAAVTMTVSPVHLRLRGEDNPQTAAAYRVAGSPPPARRGRLAHGSLGTLTWFRTIPAERTDPGVAFVADPFRPAGEGMRHQPGRPAGGGPATSW